MKTSTVIVVLWLSFVSAGAQQSIEKHMDFTGKEALSLKIQIADSIELHTWNKNEVYVKASVNINDNKDNEAYITSFDDIGNEVVVRANFSEKYFKGKNDCCNKTDIYWQVFIPEKARFSIETINANVTITGNTGEMKVKSISGYIDLSVPEKREADLDFSTITGQMYSNHELNLKTKHNGIPSRITEKLNNGGKPVKLETISGDIFFRKSN
jgi:hypothetical protein